MTGVLIDCIGWVCEGIEHKSASFPHGSALNPPGNKETTKNVTQQVIHLFFLAFRVYLYFNLSKKE